MSGRRNPFEEIERMFNRMSRQVEDEFGGDAAWTGGDRPAVDVRDDGDEFVVTADLPGYERDDIDVQLRGDKLHVAAEHTAESEEEGETDEGRFIRQERSHTSTSRTVTLPEDVDGEAVSASYQHGVLTVTLPKRGDSGGGHRIDIE